MTRVSVASILSIAVLSSVIGIAMPASAAEIGVNFAGSQTPLAPGDMAGVVPQNNFNNVTANAGTLSGALDSNANGTTLDLTYTSAYNVTSTHAGSATFNTLYANHIESPYAAAATDTFADAVGDGNRVTATLTNIPYAVYDVYIYVDNNSGVVYESTDSSTLVPAGASEAYTSPGGSTDYTVGVNYVEFAGLTGATQYFVDSNATNTGGGGFNSGFAGLQIVDASPVPEPASLGLLAVGATALLSRRRRRA